MPKTKDENYYRADLTHHMKTIIIILISILAFFAGCAKNNETSEMTFLVKKLPDFIREKEAMYKCEYKNQTPIKSADIGRLLSEVPSFFAKFTDDLEIGNYKLDDIKEICYATPAIYVKFINPEEKLSIAEWREEYGFEFFKNENGDILTFDDKKNILLPKTVNKDSAQRGDTLVYSASAISTPEKWQFFLVDKDTLIALEIEDCRKSGKCDKEYKEGDDNPFEAKEEYKRCQLIINQKKRNLCILDIARSDYYLAETIQYPPKEICGKLSEKSAENLECFWNYAMKTDDQALCEFLPKIAVENLKNYENKTEINCQNELHYTYEDADWKRGKYNPDRLSYTGTAVIEGWMIFTTSYVSDISAHFHVSANSIKKLPPSLQHGEDFLVQYKDKNGQWQRLEDKQEMPELFQYNKNNPAKIKITDVFTQMEGSPYIVLKKIIDPSSNETEQSEYVTEIIVECKKSTTASAMDSCLFDYIHTTFYDTTDLPSAEPYKAICGLIEGEVLNANCYWFYALDSKDAAVCDKLPSKFKNPSDKTRYFEGLEMTDSNCRDMLHYEYDNAEWSLKVETEFYKRYEGTAEIEGWIVEEAFYDKTAKFFHISEKDLKKLPIFIQNKAGDYFLKQKDSKGKYAYLTDDEMSKLSKYSEKSPAKIKINAVLIQNEIPVTFQLSEPL